MDTPFSIDPEVEGKERLKPTGQRGKSFKSFHPLYQRVRIDKIHNEKNRRRTDNFHKRLQKLIGSFCKRQNDLATGTIADVYQLIDMEIRPYNADDFG